MVAACKEGMLSVSSLIANERDAVSSAADGVFSVVEEFAADVVKCDAEVRGGR